MDPTPNQPNSDLRHARSAFHVSQFGLARARHINYTSFHHLGKLPGCCFFADTPDLRPVLSSDPHSLSELAIIEIRSAILEQFAVHPIDHLFDCPRPVWAANFMAIPAGTIVVGVDQHITAQTIPKSKGLVGNNIVGINPDAHLRDGWV